MKGHTLQFVHAAMAGQDRLQIPLWALLALAGAGQGIENAVENNANQSNQRAISQAEVQSRERMHNQDIMLDESKLNPFRGQMFQASDLASLDELERGSYSPVRLDVGANNPYAKYVPKINGGYSYSKSPELIAAAAALKKDVLSGHAAPSALGANDTAIVRPDGTRVNPDDGTTPMNSSVVLNLLKLLYGEDPTHPTALPPRRPRPGPSVPTLSGGGAPRPQY
jgi:hypothetical protein